MASIRLIADEGKSDHLLEAVFARFLHCEVAFSYTALFENKLQSTAHARCVEFSPTTLREENLHKLLGIFLCERFVSSSFIHLFCHLFISR